MESREERISPLTVWVIHGAFLMAIVSYVFISSFLSQPTGEPPIESRVAFMALLLLAVVQLGVAWWIPKVILSAGPTSAAPSSSPKEESAEDFLRRRQSAVVVSDAIVEATAVLSLAALNIGSLQKGQFYVLLAMTLAFLLILTPRVKGWIDEYEDLKRKEATRAAAR